MTKRYRPNSPNANTIQMPQSMSGPASQYGNMGAGFTEYSPRSHPHHLSQYEHQMQHAVASNWSRSTSYHRDPYPTLGPSTGSLAVQETHDSIGADTYATVGSSMAHQGYTASAAGMASQNQGYVTPATSLGSQGYPTSGASLGSQDYKTSVANLGGQSYTTTGANMASHGYNVSPQSMGEPTYNTPTLPREHTSTMIYQTTGADLGNHGLVSSGPSTIRTPTSSRLTHDTLYAAQRPYGAESSYGMSNTSASEAVSNANGMSMPGYPYIPDNSWMSFPDNTSA